MSGILGLAERVPPDALEAVPCGLCGSESRELSFEEPPFSVVRCRDCGLVYVTPRLRDASLLEHVYDEGYWTSSAAKERGYTDYRADEPFYLRTYRRRLPIVRRHFDAPGRVLDVGCAAGYFLRVMAEEGWDVTGLEPSEQIRPTAQEAVGADRVLGGLLEDAPFEAGSFDLVTFWDVIEHIPDFVGALGRARALLAPGGKVLIETQNVSSRAARLLGRRWQHYKHAEHIYHFDPRSFGTALANAGLRTVENTPWLGGKYVSLAFVAERAGRLHPALSWLLAPLSRLRETAVYVNLFDEMIVIAEPATGAES